MPVGLTLAVDFVVIVTIIVFFSKKMKTYYLKKSHLTRMQYSARIYKHVQWLLCSNHLVYDRKPL